ncbi:MAG: hypothetical protein JNM24_12030 [Bdellovibrionaceae bacterium]|nr:hypothetical protein [Pseudobdellovibrionaceae bacterium]
MTANDNKTNPPGGNREPRQEMLPDDEFVLEPQLSSPSTPATKKAPAVKTSTGCASTGEQAAEVLSYRHDDKRTNNPHVGMVDTHSDGVEGKTLWRYDPHIDPALQFDNRRATIENLIDDALASGVI